MLTLGLNGLFATPEDDFLPGLQLGEFFHDSAACLLSDGEVVAAVEEERLSRVKHTNMFPTRSVRACLGQIGARLHDVDRIGFFWQEESLDTGLGLSYLKHPATARRSARELVAQRLFDAFGETVDPARIDFWRHHESHAASAFYQSGFAEALVLVMDGNGEENSVSIYHADGAGLKPIKVHPTERSLGYFYTRATELLGYGLFDEYKVMGLAPYGDPSRYRPTFRSLISTESDGGYQADVAGLQAAFLTSGFVPRNSGDDFTQEHKDFAAALQESLELVVLHVLRYWSEQTSLRRLCVSGGVAHNSSMNGRILASGLFDAFFVHPASHDAGAGLGAGMLTALAGDDGSRRGRRTTYPLHDVFWGPDLGDARYVDKVLSEWHEFLEWEVSTDICGDVAKLLAEGAVVGWADGRSEFGPRALGHRSILADARPSDNKDRVNRLVKKREAYRPFAPAVLAEFADDYFEIPDIGCTLDYMGCVVPVREHKKAELGAVTHVDGTARVQVVHRESNERFWKLIDAFRELSGTPVLLNTSFNNYAEPIVQDCEDCVVCFLTTDLDYLVLGDRLVRRRPLERTRLLAARVVLPELVELTEVITGSPQQGRFAICRRDRRVASKRISEPTYRWIRGGGAGVAAGDGRVAELCAEEIWRLWQDRLIGLRP